MVARCEIKESETEMRELFRFAAVDRVKDGICETKGSGLIS